MPFLSLPPVLRLGLSLAAVLLAMFLPFLPGRHDVLAPALSGMAQLVGTVGLALLMPAGAVWWFRQRRPLPVDGHATGRICARIASTGLALVTLLCAVIAHACFAWVLALGVLAFGGSLVWQTLPRAANPPGGNPAPRYLVGLPLGAALAFFTLLTPAADAARGRAIAATAPLFAEIEQYRQAHGHYPLTLVGLWQDYPLGVVGVPRYDYEPVGDTFQLSFRMGSTVFGAEEVVVYNPRDEHLSLSHDTDRIRWTAAEQRARRTWVREHAGPAPHWKYFWFD
jgi:hypothetical protein